MNAIDVPHTSETDAGIANIARNTRGLKPGWYVTTNGFFWHDAKIHVEAGPFATRDEAIEERIVIEQERGIDSLWIDEVAS